MIQLRRSLRARFTAAATALVIIITGLLAVSLQIGQEHVERQLLESLMRQEIAEYERLHEADHGHPPPRSGVLSSYLVTSGETGDLPPELMKIGRGIHHDIRVAGRDYQIANVVLGHHQLYLLYDITEIEARTDLLALILIFAVALAGAIAAIAAWRLSSMVISPVTSLAHAIGDMDPQNLEPKFERLYPGIEVGPLARAVDGYLTRISHFIRRERAFTEDASHEMRTPLTVISTTAERMTGDPNLADSLRPLVDRIQKATRQMHAATQALLYMAREREPASAALERAPLREVAEQALEAQRDLLAGKPRTLIADLDGAADTRIPRGLGLIVMRNLLQNAIDHSVASDIRLELSPEGFSVCDGGPGLPAGELERVFDRSYRGAHSRGQGLGLDISKRICDRMGWTIRAEAIPGQGTRFTVRFEPAAI